VPGRKEIRLRLFTFYAKCGQASTNPLRPACGRQAYAALREKEKFYQWTKALLFFPIVLRWSTQIFFFNISINISLLWSSVDFLETPR
jgi:hypothetical protein